MKHGTFSMVTDASPKLKPEVFIFQTTEEVGFQFSMWFEPQNTCYFHGVYWGYSIFRVEDILYMFFEIEFLSVED